MEDMRDMKNLLMTVLGVSEDIMKAELSCGSVKLSWLEMYFCEVNEGDTDVKVDRCAQAYLLYVFGSTLFCDKSGSMVQVNTIGGLRPGGYIRMWF